MVITSKKSPLDLSKVNRRGRLIPQSDREKDLKGRWRHDAKVVNTLTFFLSLRVCLFECLFLFLDVLECS